MHIFITHNYSPTSLIVNNFYQQYLLLKPAPLHSLVPADGFHFFNGTASRRSDSSNDLQQVGQLLHGLALLIFGQLLVQLFVQLGEIILIGKK